MSSDIRPDVSLLSQYAFNPGKHAGRRAGSEVFLEGGEQAAPVLSLFYRLWRRSMDLTFGLGGLVALLLILLLLAPFMYLDSPGPLFYSQPRVGYRGKRFIIYKLRSMCPNAEPEGQAVWATNDDARITRVGRFLRKTHLDELPQALNVLRGEMSLIGPRPQREEYELKLTEANPLYRSRLAVKPGLTGWSQVQCGYGNGNEEELSKLHYDLYYIQHQSCMLDLNILLKTVVEVIRCHGI